MRYAGLFAVALVVLPAVALAAALPSPSLLKADIDTHGAAGSIATLQKNAQWEDMLDQVEAGKAAWLKLVPALRHAGNAIQKEALDTAVSKAIRHNPSGVLRLVGHGIDVETICMDRAATSTVNQVRRFREDTEKALRRVRDPALQDVKGDCLQQLYNRLDSARADGE